MKKGVVIAVNIFIALLIAFIATMPVINKLYIDFDDVSYHSATIIAMAKEIASFHLPFGVLSNAKMGNGLATVLCYPSMFVSIAAWLIVFGFRAMTATKIWIFIINLITAWVAFYSAKKITKSSLYGWIISCIYTFSIYRLGDIYSRFAVSEFVAMAFMPLVLYALYNMFYEKEKRLFLFPISAFLIVNSHWISTTFVAIIFAIFFLLNITKLNKSLLLFILKSCGLCVLVGIGVLIPMLEQTMSNKLALAGPWDMSTMTQNLKSIFSNKFIAHPKDFGIGLTLFAFPLTAFSSFFFFKKETKESNKFYVTILFLSILFFIMSTNLAPWKLLQKPFEYLQFPFRFNILVALLASFSIGLGLKYVFSNNRIFFVVIAGLLLFNSYSIVADKTIGSNDDWFWKAENVLYSNESGHVYFPTSEYMPKYADINNLQTRAVNLGNNKEYDVEIVNTKHVAAVEKGKILMPVFWYVGYSANLETVSGEKISLKIEKGQGEHVLLDVPQDGVVTLVWRGTLLYWVAKIVSYSCLVYLVVLYINGRKKADKSGKK